MAVYTHLQEEELRGLARAYGLGELRAAQPIAEGVENSNYLLSAGEGPAERRAILTIYEKRVKREEVPFFLALMEHLAARGLPTPRPLRRQDGAWLTPVQENKLAAMVSFLEGSSVQAIRVPHLQALGEGMARMHLAVRDFDQARPNDLSLSGWQRLFDAIAPRAGEILPGLADALAAELAFLHRHWPTHLERGVIHADLFPDNAFFQGERLSGIIDFYFACTDFFLYDLVIAMNAWCFEAQREFNVTKAAALLASYHRLRPIGREELEVLPILARGASLRFLLTRAYDWLHRHEGALVQVKDPLEYHRKLLFHQRIRRAGEYGL